LNYLTGFRGSQHRNAHDYVPLSLVCT